MLVGGLVYKWPSLAGFVDVNGYHRDMALLSCSDHLLQAFLRGHIWIHPLTPHKHSSVKAASILPNLTLFLLGNSAFRIHLPLLLSSDSRFR